jgi:hypothetical protein
MTSRTLGPRFRTLLAFLVLPGFLSIVAAGGSTQSGDRQTRFADSAPQAAEFIRDSHAIVLTSPERDLRDRALRAIASPCCSKFPMATCCCSCNLAKSVWGVTNVMIQRGHPSESQIQGAVREWLAFVNPSGFDGRSCDTPGGCARAFSKGGCGGMSEGDLHGAH